MADAAVIGFYGACDAHKHHRQAASENGGEEMPGENGLRYIEPTYLAYSQAL